jgi:hypothetical protein
MRQVKENAIQSKADYRRKQGGVPATVSFFRKVYQLLDLYSVGESDWGTLIPRIDVENVG